MPYLFKLFIGLTIAIVTWFAGDHMPSWAWTFGWIGATLYWIVVPSGSNANDLPRVEHAERIQALSLAAGDTLVLSVGNPITKEQHDAIKTSVHGCIPDGCKVMVLHRGLSIAGTINAKRPIPHIPMPNPGR